MWCLRQTLVLSLRHQVERALSSALSITGNHRGHAHLVPQTDIVTLSRVLASNYERERLGASDRHWCSLYLVPQREQQRLSEAPHCCSLYLVPQIDIVALSLSLSLPFFRSPSLSFFLFLIRSLSLSFSHRLLQATTGHANLVPQIDIVALSRVLASNNERERLGASDRHWCSLYLVPQREQQCLSEAPHGNVCLRHHIVMSV